jgi:hypothetical protein
MADGAVSGGVRSSIQSISAGGTFGAGAVPPTTIWRGGEAVTRCRRGHPPSPSLSGRAKHVWCSMKWCKEWDLSSPASCTSCPRGSAIGMKWAGTLGITGRWYWYWYGVRSMKCRARTYIVWRLLGKCILPFRCWAWTRRYSLRLKL